MATIVAIVSRKWAKNSEMFHKISPCKYIDKSSAFIHFNMEVVDIDGRIIRNIEGVLGRSRRSS